MNAYTHMITHVYIYISYLFLDTQANIHTSFPTHTHVYTVYIDIWILCIHGTQSFQVEPPGRWPELLAA